MKVVFMLVNNIKYNNRGLIIKTINYSRTVVPNVCSNIRLENNSYHVLAVEYDYDLGIITVNLKNI